MDISIVVPSYNEEESIPELAQWIKDTLAPLGLTYEVLFIDDGSSDRTWEVIEETAEKFQEVKGLRLLSNRGKSAALNVGFKEVKGRVVFTMDADLQDSPEELPEMRRMILEDKLDIVSGWKKKRHDPLSKTIPTKLYNWATRRMSGIYLHDFNCGLKAYRHEVVKSVELQGEMHRYIPILAKQAGFRRIGEKVVQHQERKYGKTKFGMERFINGLLDLLTVTFVTKFGKRPMHLFGAFGLLMFIIGTILLLVIGGNKLYNLSIGVISDNITTISAFYIALAAMLIGVQFFLAGFLGELISRNRKPEFKVSERVGFIEE